MFVQNALVSEMGKLQGFALRLTRNKSDADDLVQSTCLRALEKAHYFQEGTNLFRWTSKIMFNLFVSNYRRRAKFETRFDPENYLEKITVAPTQEVNAEVSDIKTAMTQLSAEHREILILICVKGMHYSEVSDLMKIRVGTVRSRLSRARESLKFIMDNPPARTPAQIPAYPNPANANMPVIPAYLAAQALQQKIYA